MRLSYTSLLNTSPDLHFLGRFKLSPFAKMLRWLCANTLATASDYPIYNIFVPQKLLLSKISGNVIARDLCPSS